MNRKMVHVCGMLTALILGYFAGKMFSPSEKKVATAKHELGSFSISENDYEIYTLIELKGRYNYKLFQVKNTQEKYCMRMDSFGPEVPAKYCETLLAMVENSVMFERFVYPKKK